MLSVIIPAYNAQATIAAAIGSAYHCLASEVIVVDDGSHDQTAARAAEAGAIVVSQLNAGAAAARIHGSHRARSEFVILLDADDELVPAGVSASLQLLRREPLLGLVVGVTEAIGRDGGLRVIEPWPEGIDTRSLLTRASSVGPPAAVVWRRNTLVECISDDPPGIWPPFAEDYEILLRASLVAPIGTHTTSTCRYALVGGKSGRNALASLEAAETIRRHYAAIAGQSISLRSKDELRALTRVRRAFDAPGRGSVLVRIANYICAVVIYPPTLIRALRSLVSRHRGGRR